MNAKKIEALRAALAAGLQVLMTTKELAALMIAMEIDGEWRELENHLPCRLLYSAGEFRLDGRINLLPVGELGGQGHE